MHKKTGVDNVKNKQNYKFSPRKIKKRLQNYMK